jgi:hypothetical protein
VKPVFWVNSIAVHHNPRGVTERATQPFELIHSDVCGPKLVSSLGGSRYYVIMLL